MIPVVDVDGMAGTMREAPADVVRSAESYSGGVMEGFNRCLSGLEDQGYEVRSAKGNYQGWDGMEELGVLAGQSGDRGGSEALESSNRCPSGLERARLRGLACMREPSMLG